MSRPSCWYRVFGSRPDTPDLAQLRSICRVQADDKGWYRAQFPLLQSEIEVNRWLPQEDGIRGELNTWAAWVEANAGPESAWLLQHLAAAAQLFTWEMDPRSPEALAFSGMLCHFLCEATAGVYQRDGQGFFQADGSLLVRESP